MRATSKLIKVLTSIKAFIEPLPTDVLIWLAKSALDEVADRQTAPLRASKKDKETHPQFLHPSGRTLR